jgi:hypothetical protein
MIIKIIPLIPNFFDLLTIFDNASTDKNIHLQIKFSSLLFMQILIIKGLVIVNKSEKNPKIGNQFQK